MWYLHAFSALHLPFKTSMHWCTPAIQVYITSMHWSLTQFMPATNNVGACLDESCGQRHAPNLQLWFAVLRAGQHLGAPLRDSHGWAPGAPRLRHLGGARSLSFAQVFVAVCLFSSLVSSITAAVGAFRAARASAFWSQPAPPAVPGVPCSLSEAHAEQIKQEAAVIAFFEVRLAAPEMMSQQDIRVV